MLKIVNKSYYIDVDKLFEFVVEPIDNKHKEKSNSEVSEYYKINALGVNEIVSREIREIKANYLQIDSAKYDFIKLLLEEAFSTPIELFIKDNIDHEDIMHEIIMLDGVEIGSIYALNTLKKLEILKEENN